MADYVYTTYHIMAVDEERAEEVYTALKTFLENNQNYLKISEDGRMLGQVETLEIDEDDTSCIILRDANRYETTKSILERILGEIAPDVSVEYVANGDAGEYKITNADDLSGRYCIDIFSPEDIFKSEEIEAAIYKIVPPMNIDSASIYWPDAPTDDVARICEVLLGHEVLESSLEGALREIEDLDGIIITQWEEESFEIKKSTAFQ